ncbi:olfactory receptor 7A17-like [Suncus etruscus]|uniref:olfactory receptor 7A17-like n=1 Tax=Suncus etruscus TaxID=109475 RepID=UPI00210FCC6B|nr:olfactory receptor 7A17-like [Suncus etruscus]
MSKQYRNPPHLVTEDASSEDISNISHLHNLSDQDFREEMLKLFKGFKETKEETDCKTQEGMDRGRQLFVGHEEDLTCKRIGEGNRQDSRQESDQESFIAKFTELIYQATKRQEGGPAERNAEGPSDFILDLYMETSLSEFTSRRYLHNIKPENESHILKFFLLGFSEQPELQSFIFVIFLFLYLITVLGNLLIILAVISDSHLHTPMYFFLSNLSFVDICFTSTTVPELLLNIQMQNRAIVYEACFAQMYFCVLFSGMDICLLTVMAYDRFVAICHPLHYTVIMNPRVCGLLVLGSWMLSNFNSLVHSLLTIPLSFCTDFKINNFFCELKQIILLACSDTLLNNVVLYLAAVIMGVGSLVGILYSYSKIVSSIRGISSAQGKYKAFSTCVSHLSVVFLFFCAILGVYLSSNIPATHSSQSNSITSVMYTVITPMLNPFIYSLRNNQMKSALKSLFVKRATEGHLSQ